MKNSRPEMHSFCLRIFMWILKSENPSPVAKGPACNLLFETHCVSARDNHFSIEML